MFKLETNEEYFKKEEIYLNTFSEILSSNHRGNLIEIIGRASPSPYSKEIKISTYSGLIFKIDKDEHYYKVFFLSQNGLEYIFVHKDKFRLFKIGYT